MQAGPDRFLPRDLNPIFRQHPDPLRHERSRAPFVLGAWPPDLKVGGCSNWATVTPRHVARGNPKGAHELILTLKISSLPSSPSPTTRSGDMDGTTRWMGTQITLRQGQTRQGHRLVRIVAARVFEDLEVISRAAHPRDVELLSSVCPLVLAESVRPGEFVMVAGVRTWHAALAVGQDAAGPMRLSAVIVSATPGTDHLAAELLTLDIGTRITSSRGAIGQAVCRVLNSGEGAAKRGTFRPSRRGWERAVRRSGQRGRRRLVNAVVPQPAAIVDFGQ